MIEKIMQDIIETKSSIGNVEKQIIKVESDLEEAKRSNDMRELEYLRTKERGLRTKEKQLRAKEEKLRTKEKQLRNDMKEEIRKKDEVKQQEKLLTTSKGIFHLHLILHVLTAYIFASYV